MESYDVLEEDPSFPEYEGKPIRKLDYLGYAPCPIRNEMKRRMYAFYRRHEKEFGKIEWFSPSGCGEKNDPYDTIWLDADADEMPAVISDGGSSDFFKSEGHRRWIASGVYGPLEKGNLEIRDEFKDAGIVDPLEAMHVYACFPSIMLIDYQKLGNRPAPTGWESLMDPIYRNDITISGWEDDIPDLLAFNYYKNFGVVGLKALAKNVRNFWSPAEMAKTAGSAHPEGTAIYVLNHFFARANRHKDKVKLLWPEEGSWFNPLMVLAKKERRPQSQLAVDFLLGAEWAEYLDTVGAPSVYKHPHQQPLPGKMDWLGWDFIRSNDLEALRPELNRAFFEARKS